MALSVGPGYTTREEWLEAAADRLIAQWPEQFAPKGEEPSLPPMKFSAGLPKGTRKHIGQCWPPTAAHDGLTVHIFVSPVLTDPVAVLATLLHELVHARVGNAVGHRRGFSRVAGALGLVKPWTATSPSEGLATLLGEMAAELGAYPHVGLNLHSRPKQPTRMLLYECSEGTKIRHAGTDLNVRCEDCGELFKLQSKGDD